MTPANIQKIATDICLALGLTPTEQITPLVPGLPGQRWTQFIPPAEAAWHAAREQDPGTVVGLETSEEIASIAGRLLHHDDADVRRVAASALGQHTNTIDEALK